MYHVCDVLLPEIRTCIMKNLQEKRVCHKNEPTWLRVAFELTDVSCLSKYPYVSCVHVYMYSYNQPI